jgi:hypothetical protein
LVEVAVLFSTDTVVVNETLVLRSNISDENRHLRQTVKRYQLFNRASLFPYSGVLIFAAKSPVKRRIYPFAPPLKPATLHLN